MSSVVKRNYSILIGNLIDHFDTALYGFLAPIFAKLYFSTSDPVISLILAYSVFATAIITKPLGAYIFGIIALNRGPALSLSYSLIGVSISTMALGLLPTSEHIGIIAPVLLIFFRILSGIFSAGEISIAKLYILTDVSDDHSNKNAYLYQTSTMAGIVLASFISTIILADKYQHLWRIGFIAGGILAFFGYFLRIYKTDLKPSNKQELLKLYSFESLKFIISNKNKLFRIAIVSGFSYVTYSIPFLIVNSLAPMFAKVSLEKMMEYNTILLVLDMIFLPIIGISLVNFKSKYILLTSSIILFLTSPILWYFAKDSSYVYLTFIKIWIIIIGITFSCKVNLWINELMKGGEKYIIAGVGEALGTALLGKMAPVIILSLYLYLPSPMVFSLFITIVIAGVIWAVGQK